MNKNTEFSVKETSPRLKLRNKCIKNVKEAELANFLATLIADCESVSTHLPIVEIEPASQLKKKSLQHYRDVACTIFCTQ